MKHPFELNTTNTMSEQDIDNVAGAKSIPVPAENSKISPAKPVVYFTQALGEDGGDFPSQELI